MTEICLAGYYCPELGVANTCRQSNLLNKILIQVEIGLGQGLLPNVIASVGLNSYVSKAHNDFGS